MEMTKPIDCPLSDEEFAEASARLEAVSQTASKMAAEIINDLDEVRQERELSYQDVANLIGMPLDAETVEANFTTERHAVKLINVARYSVALGQWMFTDESDADQDDADAEFDSLSFEDDGTAFMEDADFITTFEE